MEDENNIEVLENCQVEWDKRRGVLYVHNKETGSSVIRICQLPPCKEGVTLRIYGQLIDIVASPAFVVMPNIEICQATPIVPEGSPTLPKVPK